MIRNYPVKADQTIETINNLLDDGIKKIGAMIRHSDRFYAKEAIMEPFMGLNENGKQYAYDMGKNLRKSHPPKLFSSLMARCVESAYLIDKGFTKAHGIDLANNTMDEDLFAFYIGNIVKAIGHVQKTGTHPFLRSWFNREIPTDVMHDPIETENRISTFMSKTVKELDDAGQVAICVSHDWNVFPVKEFRFGLDHETYGDIGYLDGVVYYEKDGDIWVTCYQAKEPVKI